MKAIARAGAGLVLAFLAASASASEPAPPPAAAPAAVPGTAAVRRPDILLVTFDTLRRDHVSCYGAENLTTPHVDALAASGVRFSDCQAVVPLTGPSHVSILTGVYPQEHGVFRNGVQLARDKPVLQGMLKAAGYRTGAVLAGWTLKRSQCSLERGFDTYDDEGMEERYAVVNLMRRADAVTDAALKWADAFAAEGPSRPPYFLFVHYFDPHEPYEAPPGDACAKNPGAGGYCTPKFTGRLAEYDREIAFSDREMGRLLEGLRTRGLMTDTLVLFTADHGQAFGDHGYGDAEGAHGRRVYQDNVAVPLVVSWPGRIPAGKVNALPTCHLDLVPTIAAAAGITASIPAGLPGYDLLPALEDPSAPAPWGNARRVRRGVTYRGAIGNKWNIFRWAMNRDVEAAEPLYAYAIADGKKIIVDFTPRHRVEAYDLAADPWEAKPLPSDAVPGRDAWAQSVLDWYERTKSPELRATQPTGAELENLRSLGYVE